MMRSAGAVGPPESSWSRVAYWFVLSAAAAVDVVNFQGVVALVMRESADFLTWTVVGGFTVLALALSHRAGVAARGQVEQERHTLRTAVGWLAFSAWFGMGLFAFAVRLNGPQAGSVLAMLGQNSPSILPASMFLTFYLATGLVAGLAGFSRPSAAAVEARRRTGLQRRLDDELDEVEGRIAELESTLTAVANRVRRRQDELRLELAVAGADQLAAMKGYNADLTTLDEQELRSRNELARLRRTAQRITSQLHDLESPRHQ
jgi:hypothetical protein